MIMPKSVSVSMFLSNQRACNFVTIIFSYLLKCLYILVDLLYTDIYDEHLLQLYCVPCCSNPHARHDEAPGRMKAIQVVFLFISLAKYCSSIPINNGVLGDVEVACGSNMIELNFNVQNSFEGHVYVKVGCTLQTVVTNKI